MEDNKTKPLFTQDAKSADISRSGIRCMGCMELFSAEYELCPKCGYAVGSRAKSPYCLKPGTNLSSRYMLGKVIGQGGFGITYIGWDTAENRRVAIKEFFPNALSTRTEGETLVSCYNEKAENYFKEGVRKMMDEGERLSKFSNHPNIVNVCDSFEENNTAYIVMEYLDGKSLKEYADEKGGRISPEEAVRLMMPVLDALNAMHRENMIHRDIAPDNICICNDGNIKLLDFGSARIAVQDAEKSLSVMVKPGYAPKEQYASRSKQGPWTDVYSVCATLYRLITGEAPVESIERDTTPLKTFASFGITGYDVLENIIVKGLEPDYEKRLRNAEALKNIITKMFIISNEQIIEENVSEAKEETDGGKLNKSDWSIAGGLFAFFAVLIFVVMIGNRFYIAEKNPPKILYSGDLNNSVSWSINDEGHLLIEGTGEIPDFDYDDIEKDGYLLAPWYEHESLINSVVISNGITRIGRDAIRSCHEITSIEIPDTVTSIGDCAFAFCNGLTSITIPDSVASIGKEVFGGCDSLMSITIPDNVTSIGKCTFWSCTSLTSVTIPDSVISIGEKMFYNCTSLTSITIPDNVTNIGKRAFFGCTGLTSVTISDSVTNIGEYAFYDCSSLESITIPDGVTTIGANAFNSCESLKNITIPHNIISIGSFAFNDCTSLKDVYYGGAERQWNEIKIGYSNDSLLEADIHFNSYTVIVGLGSLL